MNRRRPMELRGETVYLNGLKQKDLNSVPFAPDVTFESPLSPKIVGKEQVVEEIRPYYDPRPITEATK